MPLHNIPSPAAVKVISGYILPERHVVNTDQDHVSESEDEEDRQPEFLDMKEMDSVSSGGQMFHFSFPASKEVDFMAGGIMYRIDGRFPLRDPWWSITCTVRNAQRKCFVKGHPSYSLRTDLGSEGQSIVSLFLTACSALPEFVTMFMAWLPKDRQVEPANVMDALQDFEESKPEHKAIADHLKSIVNRSAPGTHVRVASMYPGIMKYLPTLLPGRFMAIINKGIMKPSPDAPEGEDSTQPPQQQPDNTDVLAKLEALIKTDVWKLGFNYIMFKELHLVRCEAKVEAFELCGLFNTIPDLQRDALLLYAEIKRYCSATGSTYIQQDKLEDKIGYERTWEARHFLEEQGVLKRERKKVALQNLFGYENGIAECLRSLVEKEPWRIQLNVKKVLHRAHRKRLRAKACENQNAVSDRSLGDDVQASSSNMEDDEMTSDSDSDSWDPDQAALDLDPDQVRAAEMMCENPVTVISGKGGCGKTTVVSLVVKAAMKQQTSDREESLKACEVFQNDSLGSSDGVLTGTLMEGLNGTESDGNDKKPLEVLLTAPTGRAASLLTKRTSFTAYTMHQVLWSFMCAKKDQTGEPEEWKFSKVRVLVVDEGSLVSVQILHSLLSMLSKHAQLQKFILLGDVRQLPSIDPGNTLYDLFEGLRKVRWAIEMQTNHRAESELIVKNAGLIAAMGKRKSYSPLDFDAIIDMTSHCSIPSNESFIFVQISGENYNMDLQNAIKFLLEKGPGLKGDKASQFVAFRRKDCDLINELCCKHYSGHITKNHKNKINFQPNDKVCCTKNGYVTEIDNEPTQNETLTDTAGPSQVARNSRRSFEASFVAAGSSRDFSGTQKKDQSKENERLCNGEIFFIKGDDTKEDKGGKCRKKRYLTLDDGDGRVVTASFRELQRECKLRHAWARTIHTFQGSEAETIVYVLGDSKGQNWQHFYTAVTRGQKRVYVVGREADIERAIRKMIIPRKTRLCYLVKKVVSQPGPEGEDTLTQSGLSQSLLETQSFGPSQISGFEPTQSTPVLHTPNFSQPSSSTRPSCTRRLDKNIEEPDMSLEDDMRFSQTYSWSPMNICDEPSTTEVEFESELSYHDKDAALMGTISSSPSDSSRPPKRQGQAEDCTTPSKLAKQTTSEESPLGCSRMNLLSITSPGPKPHGRKLFRESSSEKEHP
ncbi:DNA helicase B [Triplophysa dalaica]|uniref:DNA helicase B n=1 Tax=Triplophysa dalaica TaxID=1582913 RepID=UPI0024DF4C4F|nr:DNA helicase B [Triplophysa dalaica]